MAKKGRRKDDFQIGKGRSGGSVALSENLDYSWTKNPGK